MENREVPRSKNNLILHTIFILAMTAVVSAVLTPRFFRVRASNRALHFPCKSNLKNIGTAMEMYSTDNQGHYPAKLESLTPKYLKTLPDCPEAATVTYRLYTGQGPMNHPGFEDYYYVECHGENHTNVSVRGNYPAYDGISGLIERL